MSKKIIALILTILMILSTVPITTYAAELSPVSVLFDAANTAVNLATVSTDSGNEKVSGFIDFFRTIFGYYKIGNEAKLKTAAKDGGTKWKLKKDFNVTSDITVTCGSLTINGKGHTITRTNGDYNSAILKVSNHKNLKLDNIKMNNTIGRCITVNTYAQLIIGEGGASTLTSAGDTIVNYGFTQLSSGTVLKATASNSASIWNMVTEINEIGEVLLYYCDVDYILNDGKLTLTQGNSVVKKVTANSGSKTIMKNGHINTFNYYGSLDQALSKTGGKIDNFVQLGVVPTPVNLVDKLIKVATDEVGYHEKKSNANLDDKTANSGNANYTKYGKWFGYPNSAWCAVFVAWCAATAGIPYTKDSSKSMASGGMYVNAGCGSIVNYAKNQKKWVNKNSPKVGDLVFFDWQPNNSADHIGIVYKVEGSKIYTIEGNSSDMVRTRSYSYSASDSPVMGYYRWA